MRVKASISVKKGEGLIFKLKKSEPEGFPNKFKVNFEEFNYYDGEDDQIIVIQEASIESVISRIEDSFEATFNGDFYFEIQDEKFENFIEPNNTQGIDYCIFLSSIEKEIELYSDDDWEFVENSNIHILNIETNN